MEKDAQGYTTNQRSVRYRQLPAFIYRIYSAIGLGFPSVFVVNSAFTHSYLENHKRVIGKQCRPISDVT